MSRWLPVSRSCTGFCRIIWRAFSSIMVICMFTAIRRLMSFVFFQAEDGIRDYKVTGVQTCALPISASCSARSRWTILNRGRSIAISQNTTLCVKQSVPKVQFLTGGCAGTVWTGPGTDGGGWFPLQNSIPVPSATANVIFNYLGAAATAGSYTVQNPVNNAAMTVTVALSGRVTIGP